MYRNNSTIVLAAGISLTWLMSSTAGAATISTAPAALNQPNWDTAGFGDLGHAFLFDENNIGQRGGVLDVSGSVTIADLADGDDNGLAGSVPIETPGGGGTFTPGGWFDFGLSNDTPSSVLSLTFTADYIATIGNSARVGILVGPAVLASGGPVDFTQSVDLGGTTQAVTAQASAQADWYFFDVTDLTAGETLTVSASRVADASAHRFGPISGVAIAEVPEPGSLALLGLAGLLVASRRRR